MKKQILLLTIVFAMSVSLTGCFEPSARSMGATLMPAPLMHRAPADTASEVSLTATGFWGHSDDAYNVSDLDAGGGSLDLTYRWSGKMAPFFLNVAVGGFGGSLKFGCDDAYGCNKDSKSDQKYISWLETKAGRKQYSFWNVQERLLVGADASSSMVIVGMGAGLQFFQGNSDYDDIRAALDDEKLVQDIDGKADYGFVTAYWFGFNLGHQASLGNAVLEYDVLHKGDVSDWTSSLKLTYRHPTGFFVGGASNSLMEWTVHAGKQFVF